MITVAQIKQAKIQMLKNVGSDAIHVVLRRQRQGMEAHAPQDNRSGAPTRRHVRAGEKEEKEHPQRQGQ